MINLLRLFSLIMLFLISQSGIATTSNLANHQYDVDHLVLSEKIYDYDTTSNFQCCRIPSNVNAQDRSFLVFVSDFPVPKSIGKFADPKFAGQLERQLAKDGSKSVQKSLKTLEKRLAQHQEKLLGLKFKSSVEREIRTFEKQIDTAKQFLKDKGIE